MELLAKVKAENLIKVVEDERDRVKGDCQATLSLRHSRPSCSVRLQRLEAKIEVLLRQIKEAEERAKKAEIEAEVGAAGSK
eukprot:765088-Hanusia_phi.AAC.1